MCKSSRRRGTVSTITTMAVWRGEERQARSERSEVHI